MPLPRQGPARAFFRSWLKQCHLEVVLVVAAGGPFQPAR